MTHIQLTPSSILNSVYIKKSNNKKIRYKNQHHLMKQKKRFHILWNLNVPYQKTWTQ